MRITTNRNKYFVFVYSFQSKNILPSTSNSPPIGPKNDRESTDENNETWDAGKKYPYPNSGESQGLEE